MASAVASGIPLRAPPLQLSKFQDRHVPASAVRGAVNCLAQKSNLPNTFPSTSIRRRAHLFPSKRADAVKIKKFKVTAGAESNVGLEGGDSEGGNSMKQSSSNILHRRELLWGATGTFSYLSSPGLGQSAPVPPPDLLNCSPVTLITDEKLQCCLPTNGTAAVDFTFEDLPMRTRMPAHILSQDKEYVEKYNEAYKLMKLLDEDDNDPRNFKNQWHIHCDFCQGAYPEPGGQPNVNLQYHYGWAFLPWHRMYLYFHERILGELIGDRTFALPFWNWDNQRLDGPLKGGNQLPSMYTDDLGNNDVLRDALRNPDKYPPVYLQLTGTPSGDPKDIARNNLGVVHASVVTQVSPVQFMGDPYRANQDSSDPGSQGSLESGPHNTVHTWTGQTSQTNPLRQDMGSFVFSARDPIFYAHHANIDRLWTVWKNLRRENSTRNARRERKERPDADFLKTKFAFYDHNKKLVHVKISDTLNTKKLSFSYQQMESDSDWINFEPRKYSAPKPSGIQLFSRKKPRLSKDEPKSFRLERRKPTDDEVTARADEGLTSDDLEEVLVVKDVKVPSEGFFAYRVFIQLPTADQDTPCDIEQFVGIITQIPHTGRPGAENNHHSLVNFRLGIGAALKRLNIPIGESVSVTFVPDNQQEDAIFGGVEVEWN